VLERDVARANRNVDHRVTTGSAVAELELAAEVVASGKTKPESPMMMSFLPTTSMSGPLMAALPLLEMTGRTLRRLRPTLDRGDARKACI
jgi:hypothetical protein